MIGIKLGTEFLETKGSSLSVTLKSPILNKEDGSYIFNFTFPKTEKNKILLGYYSRVQSLSVNPIECDAQIYFNGAHLWNGIMKIVKSVSGGYEATVGIEKGEFNYAAKNKLLTDLTFDPISFSLEDKSKPNSILRVADQSYPEAKFAFFPVYNPNLFQGTFFDEFFNLTMPRFKLMIEEASALIFPSMTAPPFGYFFRLEFDHWIVPYTDPEGTPHTAYEDWCRRLEEYTTNTTPDRYSNALQAHPNYIYHFYTYFFEWINEHNLWNQLAGSIRLCNEFYAAGWTNFVDIKFLDHIYTPGRHIVPFPYLAGVIKESIEQIGFVHGKDFIWDDTELKTLAMVTMNMADTYYGSIIPISTIMNVRLNEHLPEITVSKLLKTLESFFNCSVIPHKDRTVDIIKNVDILAGTKVIDWSNDVSYVGTSISKSAYKFHISSENDEWWTANVKQEGVQKYERIADVWSVQDLPDAWVDIRKINVVCWVNDHLAWYITTFENQQLVWKQYAKCDADYIVDSQYEEVTDISCDLGYLLKQPYGWYMGSDSHFFVQQGLDVPYFEFPRCGIKGNNLLHAISFDAEYNPASLKLMFYRGWKPFSPNPVANAHFMPHGAADDKYLNSPIAGCHYSLLWDGENGIYNRFHKDWIWWLNNRAKQVTIKKVLSLTDIMDFDWTVKRMIHGTRYLVKEMRFDIDDIIHTAEIDLVSC